MQLIEYSDAYAIETGASRNIIEDSIWEIEIEDGVIAEFGLTTKKNEAIPQYKLNALLFDKDLYQPEETMSFWSYFDVRFVSNKRMNKKIPLCEDIIETDEGFVCMTIRNVGIKKTIKEQLEELEEFEEFELDDDLWYDDDLYDLDDAETQPKLHPGPSVVNVSIYTKEAWQKTQDGGNLENYGDTQNYNCVQRVLDTLDNMDEYHPEQMAYVEKARVVTIDEEYFEWLEENHKEDDQRVRLEYINSRTDKDIERLLKKNRKDKAYSLCVLPLWLTSKKGFPAKRTDIVLTDEQSRKIGDYLKEAYKCDVRVFGQVMKMEDAYRERGQLYSLGVRYCETGKYSMPYKYKEQRYKSKDVNTAILCIPFITFVDVESAVFDVDTILIDENGKFKNALVPDLIPLDGSWDDEDAEEIDMSFPTIEESGVIDLIKTACAPYDVNIVCYATCAENIPECYEEMRDVLERAALENNTKIKRIPR